MPSLQSDWGRSQRHCVDPRVPFRRKLMVGGAAFAAVGSTRTRAMEEPLRFGLTPVFLNDDLNLLADLERYLVSATDRQVRLITRRTYQEITTLLVAGELDAAWICGYPFVEFRDRLSLLAVPVWRGDTLYQSYLIAKAGRAASDIEDLAGDIHAFSDPDSNSGYLVTRAMLAQQKTDPDRFFRRSIFTYSHRNVVRAVASGLSASGSVDGYVVEVLREVEPELAAKIEIVRASEWLGFPPICVAAGLEKTERVAMLRRALFGMIDDPIGRDVLSTLRLEGFAERSDELYDPIAEKVALVRRFG